MPSTKITKTNIEIDILELLKSQAAVNDLSATKMLTNMVLFYITKHK